MGTVTMSRMVIVGFAALIAAACSPEPQSPAPAETTAPVSGATAQAEAGAPLDPAIQAASLTTPEAFVRALYDVYAADPGDRDNQAFYSARTKALRDEAIALNGYFDVDPIISAQDYENVSVRSATTTLSDAAHAVVSIVFTSFGADSNAEYRLVKEAGGWRIDDIKTAEMPSLVTQIEEANARDRAAS